jgi:hypothetical protein
MPGGFEGLGSAHMNLKAYCLAIAHGPDVAALHLCPDTACSADARLVEDDDDPLTSGNQLF